MFTLVITNRETKNEEYLELGENFRVFSADNNDELLKEVKEKWPEALAFIASEKSTVPVLRDATYELKNSLGNTVKTWY